MEALINAQLEYDPKEQTTTEQTAMNTLMDTQDDLEFDEIIKGMTVGQKNEKSKEKTGKHITGSAYKIDDIMEILDRFDTYNTESITEMIQLQEDKNLLLRWRSYTTSPNFTRMFHQAITEHKLTKERSGKTYIDHFIKNCPASDDTETMCDTSTLFVRWCQEQNLKPYTLLVEMYAVLGKRNPKKNCIMLQGASNAGKTYWMKALCPFPENVGQTVQSNDFAYQNCIDKDVINIPELSLTKPEQCEELKKIMEGYNSVVNVKNKQPQILKRTPILLQCNTTPLSRNFGQERHAFLNRMYNHENLVPSDVLKNNAKKSGGADPRFFATVFQTIKDIEDDIGTEWSYEQQDPYWKVLEKGALDAVATHHDALAYNTTSFREQLLQKQTAHDMNEMQRLVENGRDILNNGHDKRIMANCTYDRKAHITNWLLAISDPRVAQDVYWNIDDYCEPILMDATRKDIYDPLQDMDQFDMDSFRIGVANIEFLLRSLVEFPNEKPLRYGLSNDLMYKQKKVIQGIKNRLLEVIAQGHEVLARDVDDEVVSQKYPENWMPLAVSTPKKTNLIRRFDDTYPKYDCIDILRTQNRDVAILSNEISRTDGLPSNAQGILAGVQMNPNRSNHVVNNIGDNFEPNWWTSSQMELLKTNLNSKPRTVGTQTEISNINGTEELVDQKEEVDRNFEQDGRRIKIKLQNMLPVHEYDQQEVLDGVSPYTSYSSNVSTPAKRRLNYSADQEDMTQVPLEGALLCVRDKC